MSNLSGYLEKYDLAIHDFGHRNVDAFKSSISIFEKSIEIASVPLFNNEPNDIFIPNEATEIIYMGYMLVPSDRQEGNEFRFFLHRVTIHGKLKDGVVVTIDHLKKLILNRFIVAKNKYDIRVLDFSFSSFYGIYTKEVPEELIKFALDEVDLKTLSSDYMKGLIHNFNKLPAEYRQRLETLVELID